MITQRSFRIGFLACLVFFFSGVSYAVTLQDGVPYQTSLDPSTINQVDFLVPSNTESLTVKVTGGTGDLDLYLKFGSPVSGTTVAEIDADADAMSVESTADETITLSSSTTPVLKAGTWYISVLNWNDYNTTFNITATSKAKAAQPAQPAQPAPAPSGNGGIPVLGVIVDEADISIIAINFSNDFDIESIAELQTLGLSLLEQLGGDQEALQVVPSDVLLNLGYNGDQLHNLAVSVLSSFESYFQVTVTKSGVEPNGKIQLKFYLWDSEFPSGQYMGGLEIADPIPLMQLLSIMSEGTRYIKIKTITSSAVGGVNVLRIETYFQDSASPEDMFLATIEIADSSLTDAFSSLQTDE